LSLAEELAGSRTPAFVYGQLISLCDQRADVRQAERVWQVMQAKRINVDWPTRKLLVAFGLRPANPGRLPGADNEPADFPPADVSR
jgi:hypothetical protein